MTEQQWIECADPLRLLLFLHQKRKASDRKLRLFGCACCRRIWHLLPDQANRDLVAAVEDRPDGTSSDPELWAAIVASSSREYELRNEPGFWAAKYLGTSYYKYLPLDAAITLTSHIVRRVAGAGEGPAEPAAQADLVREIFGNAFHLLPPRPEAIAPLAEQVCQGHWDLIPLLGEWLQEHGYWSEGEHCLDPNVHHVKGCWVVDWVTGRR